MSSRRKAKRNASNKMKNLTKPNHHSSPNVHFQVSPGQNKMEGSLNGTMEETQEVESQSEQDKEVEIKSTVASGGEISVNENPGSVTEQPIENEEVNKELIDSEKLEEKQEVSEAVVESVVSSTSDFTEEVKESVENLDFVSKQEEVKDLPSQEEASGFSPIEEVEKELEVEEKDLPSSVEKDELPTVIADEANEVLEANEMLEKAEETLAPSLEDNSSSSLPQGDVVSKVTEETTLLKSDETNKTEATPKGTEETATDVKIEESSVVFETSEENTNESSQPVANVPADETTSATVQDKNEVPRSIENPTTVSVNERQPTRWRSCCGLFELLRGGDR